MSNQATAPNQHGQLALDLPGLHYPPVVKCRGCRQRTAVLLRGRIPLDEAGAAERGDQVGRDPWGAVVVFRRRYECGCGETMPRGEGLSQ